ncbi:MAG: tyrosine-type recombinase/integrase [Bacteroidales bacterium]|nr:tyrosine-type recombinase/integrase [Bacteroidales bacterium]
MKVSFNLKNPKAEVSAVRLIVTHKGKVYRKYTGISVKTKQWKRTKRDGQLPTDDATADKLKAIRLKLERDLNEYSTEAEIITAIDRVLIEDSTYYTPMQGENGKPQFWQYFKTWSEREMPSKFQHQNAYRLIGELMGRKTTWNEVNMAYYYLLMDRLNEKKYSKNYIAGIISHLKCVMSSGFKLRYHFNTDYLNFEKSMEIPDTIYLNNEELAKLWNLDLSGDEAKRKARDLFLLGCYTASRFSDYSRLTTANIRDGYIVFTQRKTDNSVMIPLSPKVKEILDRNGGRAPELGQTYFNALIKDVCKMAGIDDDIKVTRSKGTEKVTDVQKKYKLVSSHTARRTGATLLSQTGVSLDSLMLITGHKSLASIQHYLRLGKEENARALQANPFFK